MKPRTRNFAGMPVWEDGRLGAIASTPVYHREAVRALESLRRRLKHSGQSGHRKRIR